MTKVTGLQESSKLSYARKSMLTTLSIVKDAPLQTNI